MKGKKEIPLKTELVDRGTQAGDQALKLVVAKGPDEGLEVPLEGVMEIGSDLTCTVCLKDRAVSRRHASIRKEGVTVVVKDLQSTNGTYLAGMRVTEAQVQLGAQVKLGGTVLVVHPRWHEQEVGPTEACRFGDLIGESLLMREQFALLERVAPTELSVLVEGESGTGKELAARSLHSGSGRAAGPYVVFDCGSVPRELAESELFGHRRGAFSGATGDRAGLFAEADGGTLCLDEIGELPLDLQPKLLRVLETGEIRPVGMDRPRRVNVRVVAATNRTLKSEVARGTFRADLLFRLEVVTVRMPPLRQRPEDIPALVRHFLQDHLPPGDDIAGPNLAKLVSYSWPGNVRELRNTLLRAAALCRPPGAPPIPFAGLVFNLGPAGQVQGGRGGFGIPASLTSIPYKEAKEQLLMAFDREYIQALLQRHGNNLTRSATAAGLSRKHLYQLLRKVDGS